MASSWGTSWGTSWGNSWGDESAQVIKSLVYGSLISYPALSAQANSFVAINATLSADAVMVGTSAASAAISAGISSNPVMDGTPNVDGLH